MGEERERIEGRFNNGEAAAAKELVDRSVGVVTSPFPLCKERHSRETSDGGCVFV